MITLLGPQRQRPNLAAELSRAEISGPMAVVTAGWQERESEVDELGQHVGFPVVNLRLYDRAEKLFRRDREFFQAYRQRQERLRSLQRIYRERLDYTLGQAEALFRREGEPSLLAPEREDAMAAVRALDRHHLSRVAEVQAEFRERFDPARRPSVAAEREQVREELASVQAFAVAGGHVAILLNRLRLFGIADLVRELPIFAWSGGAMVLGERVVLFHDSPPQGKGYAEVLESGLGLYHGVLPLPHPRHRLRLEDPARVALLAGRFPDSLCFAMDEGTRIRSDEGTWFDAVGRRLAVDGSVEEVAA